MSDPTASPRRALLIWGICLAAVGIALGLWIFLKGDTPFAVDAAWNDLLAGARSPVLLSVSTFLNVAGGTIVGSFVVPVVGVAAFLIARRPWSAGALVIAIAGSALLVQILKNVFNRARPEDMLVISDHGSFPSGHVANAATVAAMLVLLLPRVWAIVVAVLWVLLMAFSRTYLHAHWLSDTLGGALVGVGVALLCTGLLFERLAPEIRRISSSEV